MKYKKVRAMLTGFAFSTAVLAGCGIQDSPTIVYGPPEDFSQYMEVYGPPEDFSIYEDADGDYREEFLDYDENQPTSYTYHHVTAGLPEYYEEMTQEMWDDSLSFPFSPVWKDADVSFCNKNESPQDANLTFTYAQYDVETEEETDGEPHEEADTEDLQYREQLVMEEELQRLQEAFPEGYADLSDLMEINSSGEDSDTRTIYIVDLETEGIQAKVFYFVQFDSTAENYVMIRMIVTEDAEYQYTDAFYRMVEELDVD